MSMTPGGTSKCSDKWVLVSGYYQRALWCGWRFRTFNVVDDLNRELGAIEVDFNLAGRACGAHAEVGQWTTVYFGDPG